jgi:hypothetical protein
MSTTDQSLSLVGMPVWEEISRAAESCVGPTQRQWRGGVDTASNSADEPSARWQKGRAAADRTRSR